MRPMKLLNPWVSKYTRNKKNVFFFCYFFAETTLIRVANETARKKMRSLRRRLKNKCIIVPTSKPTPKKPLFCQFFNFSTSSKNIARLENMAVLHICLDIAYNRSLIEFLINPKFGKIWTQFLALIKLSVFINNFSLMNNFGDNFWSKFCAPSHPLSLSDQLILKTLLIFWL